MTPYYEHDGITLYHADCREVLPTLAPGSVDLVLTDPPYGVNLGNHLGAKDGRRNHVLVKAGYANYDDTEENFRNTIAPAIGAALSLCQRGIVFCASHRMWDLPRGVATGGVFVPAACGRNAWGFSSLAPCIFYGKNPTLHKGSKALVITSNDTAPANGHPCPKPITWMRWAVSLGSEEGDTILDLFAGSGTTLRAAKDMGRKAIGIEIEERYCEIAARRLDQGVFQFDEQGVMT